ncbi:MAG: hypothetical protein IKY23_10320 [Lachnospiraceae bacterium]|nr:hypothetical protein [Lachnospiraceae bacterium]
MFEKERQYINIGITPDGVAKKAIPIPWEVTAHSYNMCIPNVYFAPEDLEDDEIMDKLMSLKVLGCYIWAPLKDYSFISNFEDLRDLSIMQGENIRNLDFLNSHKECRMLLLENVKVDNLDILLDLNRGDLFTGLNCVALVNCEVADLSGFEQEHFFMEFLIWESACNGYSKNRWKNVRAAKKRYYKNNE